MSADANAAGGGPLLGLSAPASGFFDELFISTAIGIEADGFSGAARTRRGAAELDCLTYAIITATTRVAKEFLPE